MTTLSEDPVQGDVARSEPVIALSTFRTPFDPPGTGVGGSSPLRLELWTLLSVVLFLESSESLGPKKAR